MAEWKAKLVTHAANTAMALANAIRTPPVPNFILGAITGSAMGVQGVALAAAKPTLQGASGGIILPRDGGVPVNTAENGRPELLLNDSPEGSAMLEAFAQRIVDAMGAYRGGDQSITLNVDGREMAKVVSRYQKSGQA